PDKKRPGVRGVFLWARSRAGDRLRSKFSDLPPCHRPVLNSTQERNHPGDAMTTIYDFEANLLDGTPQKLEAYRGKVLLIVNVASKCGFTPQYEGLEALYRANEARGFEVLGFPCNQFGHQEPGDADAIRNFCSTRYDVTFPL